MTDLDNLIRFWTQTLEIQGYLIAPAMTVLIKQTIKALEELKELKGE